MHNLKSKLKTNTNILLIIPLLLVISTVFVVNRDFASPTVAPKYSWFGVSLILVAIAGLFLFVINRKSVRLTITDILVSTFCLWGIGLTLYLHDTFSLRLNILLLLWIFYLLCRITIVQYKHFYSILLFILIITGMIEAIWGLGQLYDYYPSQHNLFKTTGSFYNSGPYAGYLSVILPVSLYYMLFDYRIVKIKFNLKNIFVYIRWTGSLLAFILIILVLPATMSRASWLAAFLACLFVLSTYCYNHKKREIDSLYKQHKKRLLPVIIGILFLLLLSIGGMYYLKKDSADGRSLMWKTSIAAIKNNPTGVGIGCFSKYYGEAQANYFQSGNASEQEELVAGSPEYAFNEYLQIGLELGVNPLLIFISLIVYTFYIGYKRGNYAPMGGLIALLVFAFMSYPFNLLSFLIILVFLLVLTNNKQEEVKANFKSITLNISFILCTLAIVGLSVYKRYPMHEAYQEWTKVKMLNNVGIDEKQAITYERLSPWLHQESKFLFEYAQCLNRLERYEESNSILEKMANISCDPMIYNVMGRNYQAMKEYREAEKAFKRASLLIPSRLYPYYLLTKLYDEIGDKQRVLSTARIVLTKEAKVHTEAINEMREEVNKICDKYKSEQ